MRARCNAAWERVDLTCVRFVLFVILLIVAAVYYLGLYLSHTDTRVRSDIAPIAAKSAARCPTHPAPNPLLTFVPTPHPLLFRRRYRMNRDAVLKEKAY